MNGSLLKQQYPQGELRCKVNVVCNQHTEPLVRSFKTYKLNEGGGGNQHILNASKWL